MVPLTILVDRDLEEEEDLVLDDALMVREKGLLFESVGPVGVPVEVILEVWVGIAWCGAGGRGEGGMDLSFDLPR